jgi:ABC-2 type transport system permease protein
VNFSHLAAIVRLRWQITRNQFAKSGKANRILFFIMLVLAAVASLGAFGLAVLGGQAILARTSPLNVMYLWDGLAGAFLFFWAVALMVELQRSEMLSLRNLLHLPISLSGAFFLNYASSLVSLTVLLFLPGMLGLALASVLQFGGRSLVMFPLLGSFLLMVTAISYQLRGWLARLMENKRTRGTVIAIVTMTFVLIAQAPNLIFNGTMKSQWSAEREHDQAYSEELQALERKLASGEIDRESYAGAVEAAHEEFTQQQVAANEAESAARDRTASLLNAALPIGWLPYGASAAAGGAIVSPWLCVLGMSTIGLLSLWLAYRSTLRVYTGDDNKQYRPASRKNAKHTAAGSILEKSLPFLSETQSVVALAAFRSLLRAPEAKMVLLTPLILACVFGSMMLSGSMSRMPEFVRPWLGVGAVAMSLIGVAQLMLNMFGPDRHGFRAYVLMPTPRRDILIGKNVGILPIAATMSVLLVVFTGIVGRVEVTHLVATLLQVAIALLIYFTISNFISIVAPIGMAVGTMKPVGMSVKVMLWQFAAILLIPVAILPAAGAVAAEQLAGVFGGINGVPIYLLLTLVELPLALWFYRTMLNLQGRMLQEREQAILEIVSKVAA